MIARRTGLSQPGEYVITVPAALVRISAARGVQEYESLAEPDAGSAPGCRS
jgi:hypothetical protein